MEANLNVRFKPGSFSCSPPVWQTNFALHPRVKQTQGGHHGGSIALHALKNVLNAFAVTNRSNMFVYRDAAGNIFYIKIAEIISGMNSRKVTAPPGENRPTEARGSKGICARFNRLTISFLMNKTLCIDFNYLAAGSGHIRVNFLKSAAK